MIVNVPGYMISTWVLVVLLIVFTSTLTTYICLRERSKRKLSSGRSVAVL